MYIKPAYITGEHKTVQVYTKQVYSTVLSKTSFHYSCAQNQIRVHSFNSFKGLSQVEKLAALEYSFNLIYKYLTSENSSKCLLRKKGQVHKLSQCISSLTEWPRPV